MRTIPVAALAVLLISLLPGSVIAGPITLTNPGFETGDFTGWTTIPAASGSDFGVGTSFPHSGTFAAAFGATGGLNDTITQAVSTVPGSYYSFSFWMDGSENANGQFEAFWNGTPVLNVSGPVAGGYQQYVFSNLLATTGSTVIAFAGNTPPAFYYLDDVSVDSLSAVPEPASIALCGAGLLLLAVALRRRSR